MSTSGQRLRHVLATAIDVVDVTTALRVGLALAGIVAILFFQLSPLSAQSPEGGYSEEEAQAIDRMLMCPVCPAETIDQAQVEISFQMRALVREMLAEGRSRQEILDFFAENYGPDILAAPPKSGTNLLAWILPIAGVAAALVGVYFVIRSMTNRGQRLAVDGPAPTEDPDPRLGPYLEMVDRYLAVGRATPEEAPGPDPSPDPAQDPARDNKETNG